MPSAPAPDDVALLLHTSGTTSRPKQVPLRHRNLVASARSIARHYALGAGRRLVLRHAALPRARPRRLDACAARGGRHAWSSPRRVAPGRFWAQLVEHGVTWYSARPTLHEMLLDRAPERRGSTSDAALRPLVQLGPAPALLARLEALLRVPVLEAYGMTEASHEMAANPLPPAARMPGSVGVPTGAESASSTRSAAPTSRHGEVVIRGPGVMYGYLANDEANAAAFFDGWFRTGDQGRLDDGYLRLVGRLKEIIIRGGENISPLEVEDVLLRHPAVAEAVAYGMPDAKYGAGRRLPRSSPRRRPDRGRARRALPRASRGVQGAELVHIVDAIPQHADRQGAAAAHGRALRGGLMRFAILGAGAIGAYVGAALRAAAPTSC